MNVEALRALEKAVEAGTAMNSDFSDAFPVTGPSKPYWMGTSAYNNGSLDAAMAFHNATGNWPDIDIEYRLCGGICDVTIYDVYGAENGMIKATSIHGPARALLLADIRALIAQAEAKGEGE